MKIDQICHQILLRLGGFHYGTLCVCTSSALRLLVSMIRMNHYSHFSKLCYHLWWENLESIILFPCRKHRLDFFLYINVCLLIM